MGARLSVLLAALFLLVAAGCGDDDEEAAGTTTTAEPPATETAPATVPETAPAETVTVPEEEPPPEEQPGGAGDEEPAQSLAAFTGAKGHLSPTRVRVAPFIAIRVQLRSADGLGYGLRCGGREIRVDSDIASASTRIAGRRPGEKVRCAALGEHNGVTISASAEPGP
jgi:hypothetical protein